MSGKRRVEVFSAGCSVCDEGIELVRRLACSSCEVRIVSMADPKVAARAVSLGVRTVPAVVVDGHLAECCSSRGLDEAALRSVGLGRAV